MLSWLIALLFDQSARVFFEIKNVIAASLHTSFLFVPFSMRLIIMLILQRSKLICEDCKVYSMSP